jgi:hypothetical protein
MVFVNTNGFFFSTAIMNAEYSGLIPGIYFTNYFVVFVHHNLAARVAVYFLFARSWLIFF